MEENKNHIDRLIEHGGTYLHNRQSLLQHTVTEKTLVLSASAIASGVVAAIALFALVFLGIAAALWIGSVLQNNSAGFAIVGGAFLLIVLLIAIAKKSMIERPVMNAMLRREAAATGNTEIQNVDQLRAEIVKLKSNCEADELQIKKDLELLRNDLKPANMLVNIVSGITGIRFGQNATEKGGILYGLSLLMQRLMLRAEKKAEDTVYGLVDVLFQKIQDFVHKHTGHEARREERSNSGENRDV